jgi:hypothetical protein
MHHRARGRRRLPPGTIVFRAAIDRTERQEAPHTLSPLGEHTAPPSSSIP